jgi:hypothetical protein
MHLGKPKVSKSQNVLTGLLNSEATTLERMRDVKLNAKIDTEITGSQKC